MYECDGEAYAATLLFEVCTVTIPRVACQSLQCPVAQHGREMCCTCLAMYLSVCFGGYSLARLELWLPGSVT